MKSLVKTKSLRVLEGINSGEEGLIITPSGTITQDYILTSRDSKGRCKWVNFKDNYSLDSLRDVNVLEPQEGSCLLWDGTQWKEGYPLLNQLADVSLEGISINQVLSWNGDKWNPVTIKGVGIQSLNTQSSLIQSFAVGTDGNNFNIKSQDGCHKFNIPTASNKARGLLSNTDWAIFNSKMSQIIPQGNIIIGDRNNTSSFIKIKGDATLDTTGGLSLSDTGVVPGTYVNPIVSIDSKGRITNVNGESLEKIKAKVELTDTGVIPGIYGSLDEVPVLSVDSKGRITNITTKEIRELKHNNIYIGDSNNKVCGYSPWGDLSLRDNGEFVLRDSGVDDGVYEIYDKSLTVDSKGRITNITKINKEPKEVKYNNIIVGDPNNRELQVKPWGDLTLRDNGKFVLRDSGVVPGEYKNPKITIDAQGRVVKVSNGSGAKSILLTSKDSKMGIQNKKNEIIINIPPVSKGCSGLITPRDFERFESKMDRTLGHNKILIGSREGTPLEVIPSGDLSIRENGEFVLRDSGVVPGVYKNVSNITVDSKGRIIELYQGTDNKIKELMVKSDGPILSWSISGDTNTLNIPLVNSKSPGLIKISDFERFESKMDRTLSYNKILVGSREGTPLEVCPWGDITLKDNGEFQLIDTPVLSGTYGSLGEVPVITVDSKGRITHITTYGIPESVISLSRNNELPLKQTGRMSFNIPNVSNSRDGILGSRDFERFNSKMDKTLGHNNIFIGSSEGIPEEINLESYLDNYISSIDNTSGVSPGRYESPWVDITVNSDGIITHLESRDVESGGLLWSEGNNKIEKCPHITIDENSLGFSNIIIKENIIESKGTLQLKSKDSVVINSNTILNGDVNIQGNLRIGSLEWPLPLGFQPGSLLNIQSDGSLGWKTLPESGIAIFREGHLCASSMNFRDGTIYLDSLMGSSNLTIGVDGDKTKICKGGDITISSGSSGSGNMGTLLLSGGESNSLSKSFIKIGNDGNVEITSGRNKVGKSPSVCISGGSSDDDVDVRGGGDVIISGGNIDQPGAKKKAGDVILKGGVNNKNGKSGDIIMVSHGISCIMPNSRLQKGDILGVVGVDGFSYQLGGIPSRSSYGTLIKNTDQELTWGVNVITWDKVLSGNIDLIIKLDPDITYIISGFIETSGDSIGYYIKSGNDNISLEFRNQIGPIVYRCPKSQVISIVSELISNKPNAKVLGTGTYLTIYSI